MDEEKMVRSLMGMYAYDTGSVDSGIRDEELRAWVVGELEGMGRREGEDIFVEAGEGRISE